MIQVLSQDDTPLLYSLVFGEGVVNDATSVVLFNAIQSFDLTNINAVIAWDFVRNFLYLFLTSTMLGVLVSLLSPFPHLSHTHTQHKSVFLRAISWNVCGSFLADWAS